MGNSRWDRRRRGAVCNRQPRANPEGAAVRCCGSAPGIGNGIGAAAHRWAALLWRRGSATASTQRQLPHLHDVGTCICSFSCSTALHSATTAELEAVRADAARSRRERGYTSASTGILNCRAAKATVWNSFPTRAMASVSAYAVRRSPARYMVGPRVPKRDHEERSTAPALRASGSMGP